MCGGESGYVGAMVVNPVSTILRAATGIVTMYTVDVVVVWVWLTILLHILQKKSCSHGSFFTTVTGRLSV